jgi:uncharacterized membrane protein SirB2
VYSLLKWTHVSAGLLSGLGFVLRYLLVRPGSAAGRTAWVRIAPHVVDTALLATGIALAWLVHANQLGFSWLGAKLVGLALYILFGTVALKRGRTAHARAGAFLAALACFAYIVSVALTKDSRGFAGLLQ